MATREIGALDTAFLCLEQHDAPMHIGAVAVFDPREEVDPARLKALLAERVERIPRMRRHVGDSWLPAGAAQWEEDPDFRAEEHIHNHGVPWPGGPDELATLVSELVAEPLDLTRPLWELHVLTGLHGGRFAILVKLHHALADGAGAVELGLGLLDGFEPVADTHEPDPAGTERGVLGFARSMLTSISRPDRLVRTTLTAADELRHTVQQAGEALNIGWSVLRNVQMPRPASPLLAPRSASKRIELFALEMGDIRRVRKCHGGTTNDIVLAIVTGALRRWLTTRGYPVDTLRLRALVPVSHRCRDRQPAGNNRLSGYLCDLPVNEPDPRLRLDVLRSSMRDNKSAGPLRGPGALPVLADRVPPALHRLATRTAVRGAPLLFDTVITNVPLPDMPVSLDGAGLRELYPLVPLAAGHALSIAASQYRDRVHVGLQANRAALPDIEKFNEALPHALAELDGSEA
ncbi:WS/DGAT/MGAT family acyltransferase [Halopolyspora algeriensis]|uniref:Diacylglycerol O-acyltransferase n=1 Tax=Halopolyspora algeriensis TaxID=1500506 RepID=A0A368VIS1_9ACTN|nr:wax ester/triacylglycerol synthase family O-acyltransferase [Halopolyspora algeriensis]RCW39554.1 WS/DGAT/MGAT family acyltransferase [Halopolyspora algeriensis]TQM56133.1 WS/DGAT/MGAT family acyltransferase [Halopolyspora algeriensis]